MDPFPRSRFLLALAVTLLFASGARAEALFPVNDPGSGAFVFDQPSVAANGTFLHVAFIGDNTASGRYKLYYAGINGSADFTNKSTSKDQVVKTRPVAIDNGASYTDARHPQIAHRSSTSTSTSLVVLFQAIPAGAAEYKLFRALITLDNNAVSAQNVSEVSLPGPVRMTGTLVDPSFGLGATDSFLRTAYADKITGNVYFARIGVDNALVGGAPILLSRQAGTQGSAPLPRLRLDNLNRSHVAWAANSTTAAPANICYAMVKEFTPGVDNLAIGATSVLGGGFRWGFPNVLFPASSRILVLAGDESSGTPGVAGTVGVAYLNPDAVTHDGNPVSVGNVIPGNTFLVFPPGSAPLSDTFSVYRPEAALDTNTRVHVAGYGSSGPGSQGTAGTYYTMSVNGVTATTSNLADLLSPREPVGGSSNLAYASTIPGDYTRAAFIHFSTRAVLFWSGPDNVVAGARSLYVTSALSTTDYIAPTPTTQSGCQAVGEARRGEPERIPGAVLLFLPAALVGLRKLARKAFAR